MRSDLDGNVAESPAWWITGPGEGALLPAPLEATGVGDHVSKVTVEALYSGVSRGTESLVFHGRVPEAEYQRMRAPFQQGQFPYPVKYGYSNVGRVVEGPDELINRKVFCLFPHQKTYRVPLTAVQPIPDHVPAERAILAANMETAINGLWDGMPVVGDRILVVGLGVVGLLVAWLANRIPGTQVVAVDVNPHRKAAAEGLGLHFDGFPSRQGFDLVFHTSGHASGLETALSHAGNEATIVEMSWYGDQAVAAPLGSAFHSRRLTLRSSQVGQLPPARKPRWDYQRRLQLALELLADDRLDHLITGESRFSELPEVMPELLTDGQSVLCHRIIY